VNRGRVLLAMSGGVDSSVSALVLREQGYDVLGLFMRTGVHVEEDSCSTNPNPRKIRGCCSAIDAGDAQRVADRLDIPFHALDFEEDFNRIKDYFVDEYLVGRTPNPCVVCNTWVKFGKLWDYAQALDADFIATGHYARTGDGNGAELRRGLDPTKDQSYFLFGLKRELLPRILFPVGDLPKTKVREIAEQHGLGVSQKPDSQEVCFVPSGKYQDFIRQHRPNVDLPSGEIVDHTGKVLGRHQGISSFTIGQRKGLGIAVGAPRYVLELNASENQVVIGPEELLRRSSLEASGVNWLTPAPPDEPVRCDVKIRYLHSATPAEVIPLPDGRVRVEFDFPQSAITPGQATVFYQDDCVLGGGWID
jgi:tRNA-uridine 2-sulfurtransferase